MIVIDATAAVDAALTPDRFDRLARRSPAAPALLWSEATSVLSELVWREHLPADAAREALARFLSARVERHSSRALYEEATAIARELGWAKTYDAEYVALARSLGCPLVTRDGRLRRGASRLARIIDPTEL